MTQRQTICIGILILGGLAAALIIQRRSQTALANEETELHRQRAEMAALLADRERLTNRLAHATELRQGEASTELAKLREEAGVLRDRIRQRTEEQARQAAARPAPKPEPEAPRPPEYFQKLHQLAGTGSRDAMALGLGLRRYADEHQGQLPPTVDLLEPYVLKEQMPLSGTNAFDVVYHGPLQALTNVPSSAIALLRDRRTWLAPSGKTARVYGMADGSARIVESDDEFRSWEAKHVLPKP